MPFIFLCIIKKFTHTHIHTDRFMYITGYLNAYICIIRYIYRYLNETMRELCTKSNMEWIEVQRANETLSQWNTVPYP